MSRAALKGVLHTVHTEAWEIFILTLTDITSASKLPTLYVNWRMLWRVLSVASAEYTLHTFYWICQTNRITQTAFSCAEACTSAPLAEAKGIIFRGWDFKRNFHILYVQNNLPSRAYLILHEALFNVYIFFIALYFQVHIHFIIQLVLRIVKLESANNNGIGEKRKYCEKWERWNFRQRELLLQRITRPSAPVLLVILW